MKKSAGSGSGTVFLWYRSVDPDPYRNITDQEQWLCNLTKLTNDREGNDEDCIIDNLQYTKYKIYVFCAAYIRYCR
jgi:hypothetical protein